MELSRKGFGAYDIRGIYPKDVNEELAYRMGFAFAERFKAKRVAVGNDIRLSGLSLKEALSKGLCDAGCDVIDIGQCGTEMIYFATFHLKTDGGIMITASHNPKEYNGMKLVLAEARPLSRDTGLQDLENRVMTGEFSQKAAEPGKMTSYDITKEYVFFRM